MKQLNLVKNQHKVYQCQCRIQGDYLIDIPRNTKLAEKTVNNFEIPIMYKKGSSKQNMSYIVLYSCSLSRASHLELDSIQVIEEFVRTFKR